MSKFICVCSYVISTVEFPNSIEGWLYSAAEEEALETNAEKKIAAYLAIARTEARSGWLDDYFSKEYPSDQSDASIISDIISVVKQSYGRDVLERPSCGRLHVQESPGINAYRSYHPEGSKPGVFRKNAEPGATDNPVSAP